MRDKIMCSHLPIGCKNMKRKYRLFCILFILLSSLCLTSCNYKKENTIIGKKSLNEVIAEVDNSISGRYEGQAGAVFMGVPVTDRYLQEFCQIEPEYYSEFAGNVSYSITNSDCLIAVKASKNNEEYILKALQKRLIDITDQYERFPVNNSYERALSGSVYQKGSYIFLIAVGIEPDYSSSGANMFIKDALLVKQTIDSLFY